jgi:hypothetical protein
MTLAAAIAWGTVVVGLVLGSVGIRATFYFRRQLDIMGQNWVLLAFYRTAATITAVALWLTMARALTLAFGPQPWLMALSGVAVIWLLLIPTLLHRLFQSHEGR